MLSPRLTYSRDSYARCLSISASLMSLDWSVIVTVRPALPSIGGSLCPALFPFQLRTSQLPIFLLMSSPLQWSILGSLRLRHPQSQHLPLKLQYRQLRCPLPFQGPMAPVPPLHAVLGEHFCTISVAYQDFHVGLFYHYGCSSHVLQYRNIICDCPCSPREQDDSY